MFDSTGDGSRPTSRWRAESRRWANTGEEEEQEQECQVEQGKHSGGDPRRLDSRKRDSSDATEKRVDST